jgi:hypothetical protein
MNVVLILMGMYEIILICVFIYFNNNLFSFIVFAGLLISSALNPFLRDDLFRVAMLGFALTEAVALFTLMVTFLVLFA